MYCTDVLYQVQYCNVPGVNCTPSARREARPISCIACSVIRTEHSSLLKRDSRSPSSLLYCEFGADSVYSTVLYSTRVNSYCTYNIVLVPGNELGFWANGALLKQIQIKSCARKILWASCQTTGGASSGFSCAPKAGTAATRAARAVRAATRPTSASGCSRRCSPARPVGAARPRPRRSRCCPP